MEQRKVNNSAPDLSLQPASRGPIGGPPPIVREPYWTVKRTLKWAAAGITVWVLIVLGNAAVKAGLRVIDSYEKEAVQENQRKPDTAKVSTPETTQVAPVSSPAIPPSMAERLSGGSEPVKAKPIESAEDDAALREAQIVAARYTEAAERKKVVGRLKAENAMATAERNRINNELEPLDKNINVLNGIKRIHTEGKLRLEKQYRTQFQLDPNVDVEGVPFWRGPVGTNVGVRGMGGITWRRGVVDLRANAVEYDKHVKEIKDAAAKLDKCGGQSRELKAQLWKVEDKMKALAEEFEKLRPTPEEREAFKGPVRDSTKKLKTLELLDGTQLQVKSYSRIENTIFYVDENGERQTIDARNVKD